MSRMARSSAFSRGEEEIVEFLGCKLKIKSKQTKYLCMNQQNKGQTHYSHRPACELSVATSSLRNTRSPHTLASSHFFHCTSSYSLGAFVLPKQKSRQPPLPTMGSLINKFLLPWMPSQRLILAYWQPHSFFKGKCKPNSFKMSALMTPGILDQDTREWTLALSFRQVTSALNHLCKRGAYFYWSRRATSYRS